MASATAREPDVKLSNSNTPVGPFHRIVFDFLITSANRASDLGPMSIPSQPSGILSTSQKSVLASFEKSSAILASTAKTKFTWLALALLMSSRAKSSLSSSQMELPILPPNALVKV